MLNQFSRTQLLFGEAGMEKLQRSRVAVFGIGGVGGYAVEALARSGIGALDLIDDDRVCLTNLNRQLHGTRKNVGRYKGDGAEGGDREPLARGSVATCTTHRGSSTSTRLCSLRAVSRAVSYMPCASKANK